MHRLLGSNSMFRTLQTAPVRGSTGASATNKVGGFHLGHHHLHRERPAAAGVVVECSRFQSSNSNNTNSTRRNDIFRMKRPPERQEETDPRRAKWRKHAVSLEFGNYADYDDDDQDFAPAVASSSSSTTPSWQEEELGLAKQVQEIQETEDAQRKRWIENSRPPVRVPIIDDRGRAYGRGGRKTASARVWIQPGFGHVVVNQRPFEDYFDRQSDRELILTPFAATETCGKFDVSATVTGGGLTGQAGSIRHGVARALNHYNPDQYRPALKRLGYLTRDPRKVERKKIGRLKARKSPQWVKR